MSNTTPDPILAALDGARTARPFQRLLVDELYGDRPDILAKIIERRQAGVSVQSIADALSTDRRKVGREAVVRWLKTKGLR